MPCSPRAVRGHERGPPVKKKPRGGSWFETLRDHLARERRSLLFVLPAVLAALVAGWWLFLRGPGAAVAHREYIQADTPVIAVVNPPKVQAYVSSLAHSATRFVPGIPKLSSMQARAFSFDWIHKMPLEMAFLFDQRASDAYAVTLLFRENPTSESLEGLVDAGFFQSLRPVRFPGSRLARKGGGILLSEGTLPVPPFAKELAQKRHPGYIPVDAPEVSGNHFIEIAINNRNGALVELQGAFPELIAPWAGSRTRQTLLDLAAEVVEGVFTADLAADDLLECRVEAACGSSAGAEAVAEALGTAADEVAFWLNEAHGFNLEGSVEQDGLSVRGAWQLTGFEPKLRRALGG